MVLLWQEKNRTQAANDRLKGNLRLALQTLDETYLKVAEARLPRDLQRQQEDQELLKKGLDFYQQFARENSTDRAVRRETAKAYSRVGIIQAKLGRDAEAEEAYGRAATLFQDLAAEFPNVADYRRDLAANQDRLGDLLRKQARRPQEAERAHRQALALYEKLADDFPGVPAYRANVANTYNLIGVVLQSTQPGEAERAFHQAIAVSGKLVDEAPSDPGYGRVLIESYVNLGRLLFQVAGRPEEAEKAWRKALALYEGSAARFPSLAPEYRRAMATTYSNLGARLATSGRLREAEQALRQALPVREKLVNEFPAVVDFKLDLGDTLGNLGRVVGYLGGDPAEVRKLLNRAIDDQQALLNSNPQHPVYRSQLRNHYWVLAETMWRLKEHREVAQAVEALPRIFSEGPEEYERAANFLLHCVQLAEKDARLPQADRKKFAQAYAHRARELLQEAMRQVGAKSNAANALADAGGSSSDTLYDAACVYAMAAALARDDVKQAEQFAARAVELLRQAIRKGYKDVAHMKTDEDLAALRGRDDYQKLLGELAKNLKESEMSKQGRGEKKAVPK
jgi:tetratricopeptide (TPR) repeat protein